MIIKNFHLSRILAFAAVLILISSCEGDEGDSNALTDSDGNEYATIVIGNQEWMAENLRTTSYSNGDPIPNIPDNTQWAETTTGAWSHYNNNNSYDNPYGKLYNWYAVKDSRNLCPTGWHAATLNDFTILIDYLGGEEVAGTKMKSIGTLGDGTGLWYSTDSVGWDFIPGTNESGFSGHPGGFRYGSGEFTYMGRTGQWWSLDNNYDPWYLYLTTISNETQFTTGGGGYCVRCVRD
jgi:uncharacterized protein (TIGR02145 family)